MVPDDTTLYDAAVKIPPASRSRALKAMPRRAGTFLRGQTSKPSAAFKAQVWLDELVFALTTDPRLFPTEESFGEAVADVEAAYRIFEQNGWIADPASYHRQPPVPEVATTAARALRREYELLTYPSGYEPHVDEPGRERWLAQRGNHTAHTAVIRSKAEGRPWLVCIHGLGMGEAVVNFGGFNVGKLLRRHDFNLAFPVLPNHGARVDPGARPAEGFLAANLVDVVHGLAQAVWDVRATVRWIRAQDPDARIGLYGLSLGTAVAGVVAALEGDLACVVVGVPISDFMQVLRLNSTPEIAARTQASVVLNDQVDAIGAVVAPGRLTPKVPREHRYIVAGTADRFTTAAQAEQLWEHWDRPSILWYPGGHIGYFFTRKLWPFLSRALRNSLER